MVVVVPAFVLYLLSEVFPRPEPVAPIILPVVVFFLTYLLTAIGFLRERTAGTLERVFVDPVSRSGIVVGCVLGYRVLATVQSLVLLVGAIWFLDAGFEHCVALFVLVELLGALTALGIGIVLSLFAENEFQAIQFIPMAITPQVILGGTFLPVEKLPTCLERPARAMPVTYLDRRDAVCRLGSWNDCGIPGRTARVVWVRTRSSSCGWYNVSAGMSDGDEHALSATLIWHVSCWQQTPPCQESVPADSRPDAPRWSS